MDSDVLRRAKTKAPIIIRSFSTVTATLYLKLGGCPVVAVELTTIFARQNPVMDLSLRLQLGNRHVTIILPELVRTAAPTLRSHLGTV